MLQELVRLVEAHLSQLPDHRKPSPNLTYSMRDAALSALAVFCMQSPSFLACQRDMQRLKGRNNSQSLFLVEHIPSDNKLRYLLDPVAPSQWNALFWTLFAWLELRAALKGIKADRVGAKEDCDEVLKQDPNQVNALCNRIIIARIENDLDCILTLAERLPSKVFSDDVQMVHLLVSAYVQRKYFDKALVLIEKYCGTYKHLSDNYECTAIRDGRYLLLVENNRQEN